MARARNGNEIVDLVSDSEDEAPSEDGLDFFDAHDQPQDEVALFPGDQNVDHIIRELNARYHPVYEAADGIIDLTNIPDIDVPPFDPILDHTEFPAQDELGSDDQLITEAVSLQMIIDVLPDISIDHVLGIIREKTTDLTRTTAKCHEIISQLVDQETYPKEDDEAKNKKRKRGDEDDWKEYDKTDRNPAIPTYETDV
jgi:TRIAD3 protein (E3 ubiquitin-protein ligase RNF216)